EIKKRIKAVGNIRRITKTMQMIATAKFSASQQRAVAGRPYADALFALVGNLAGAIGDVSHPLLATGEAKASGTGRELTLIITSDRGLCGPYNSSVLRIASNFLKTNAAAKGGLIELVGKKGAGFLKFNNISVARQHAFGDKPSFEAIQALAQDYIDRFSKGEVSSVRVVYMKFLSAGKQVPTVFQLLPFQTPEKPAATTAGAGADAGAVQIYEFTPSATELLNELLPAAVKAMLFQIFNDAIVSEHVSRMVAMKAATDASGKLGKRYTRIYNRARQAQITTELTEIISGAAALE
ncbi:MAG: ATP synthase F1 subunit gamma, partial [Planctomycetota bacterium]|nr:ATP synthase F1 subunit gamma [Planctomycetota bacterium]